MSDEQRQPSDFPTLTIAAVFIGLFLLIALVPEDIDEAPETIPPPPATERPLPAAPEQDAP